MYIPASIELILVSGFVLANVIGVILLLINNKNYKQYRIAMEEDEWDQNQLLNFYKKITLKDKEINFFSILGGCFAICFTAKKIRYKKIDPASRFYQGLKTTKVLGILYITATIAILAINHI